MTRKSLKSIDSSLDELEDKEGLPDFDSLADEIGKALRSVSVTHQANSVQQRKKRLTDAKRNHNRELASIKKKGADYAARISPEGIRLAEELKQSRIATAYEAAAKQDVESVKANVEKILLESPDCPEIFQLQESMEQMSRNLAFEEDRRTVESLGAVADMSATASKFSPSKIVVSWALGGAGLADSFKVTLTDLNSGESESHTCAHPPFDGFSSIKLGVPYRISVVPCFHGIEGKAIASTKEPVVCTAPISGFKSEEAAGTDSFGNIRLVWKNPPWDKAAKVDVRLVREDGKSWEVSGKDLFEDDSVRAGESHRYRLEVSVAGKALDPVECEVTVNAVQMPPPIEGAFASIRGGRPYLSIPKWPDGVLEVKISRPGSKPCYLSREEYGKGFPFRSVEEASATTLQAVRRFGSSYVQGPDSQVSCLNKSPILYVSICRRKTTFLERMKAFFKQPKTLLKQPEYGMTFSGEIDGNLPPITVSIRSPGGQARTFHVPSGEVHFGVFFQFPSVWAAKRGDSVYVAVAEGGHSIRYLTSRKVF